MENEIGPYGLAGEYYCKYVEQTALAKSLMESKAKSEESRLSQSTRDNFKHVNPSRPKKIDHKTDGFFIEDKFYTIRGVTFLITSFLTIFQNSGYLDEDEYGNNYSVLEKLFLGQSLEGVTRIKWNDQYDEKLDTGLATWVQLYYIFYQLHSSGVLLFNANYKDIKSFIGYRLINSFVSGQKPPVLRYDFIDKTINGYHQGHTEKDDKNWVKLSGPKRPAQNKLELLTNLLIDLCLAAPKSSD
jgi:hypothetical protein